MLQRSVNPSAGCGLHVIITADILMLDASLHIAVIQSGKIYRSSGHFNAVRQPAVPREAHRDSPQVAGSVDKAHDESEGVALMWRSCGVCARPQDPRGRLLGDYWEARYCMRHESKLSWIMHAHGML